MHMQSRKRIPDDLADRPDKVTFDVFVDRYTQKEQRRKDSLG
jgi:hypothetical protein